LAVIDEVANDLAVGQEEPLKLLFVDDDPLLREFALEHLGANWRDVAVAADGEEALSAIRISLPDIVLLDLDMPKVDGFAVLKALRAEPATKSLPVIVITGRADEDSIECAFAAGATSFLVKPINWRQLIHQIRYVYRAAQVEHSLTDHIFELELKKHELEAASAALEVALKAADAASAAKSDFLATMSHELRTPLNAIIGFSEMLDTQGNGLLSGLKAPEYVRYILGSGRHLLSLIDDILEFSRGKAGKLDLSEDVFVPGEVIDDALRNVMQQAKAGDIDFTLGAASTGARLRGDRRRICQVLVNILANAVKFTPSGGQVGVHANQDAGGLAISVSDTGIGIAADDIPKALERFSQVDSSIVRKYEGTGLGLPLAKLLMELHGGSLHIDSAPQVGTTVTVKFPAKRVIMEPATA